MRTARTLREVPAFLAKSPDGAKFIEAVPPELVADVLARVATLIE